MKTILQTIALQSSITPWFNAARCLPPLPGIAAVLALMLVTIPARAADSGGLAAYIGTYTRVKSKGIYLCRFDSNTGAMTAPELAAETASPSFLAISPNHRFLYAVNEIDSFAGKNAGAVSAFAIDPASGKLIFLNQKTSGGPGPCHLSLDASGKHLFVANYGGGSIEVVPILGNGGLAEPTIFIQHKGASRDPGRQGAPHAHFIVQDPSKHHILAADLGLDKVFFYKYDRRNGLDQKSDPTSAQLASGSGPRHFGFGKKGRFLYVVNELNSTVTVFKYDERRGVAESLQVLSTLPEGFTGNNSCAEIAVHPSGKFLYASNRGHNSIASFSIDPADGKLTHIENQSTRGKSPRSFEIDPSGKWLVAANQDAGNLAVFLIDPDTGKLTPKGPLIEAPAPVCIKFLSLE